MKKFIIFLILGILMGCATMPAEKEISSANYGPIPTNVKEKAIEEISKNLFDPWSAHYRLCEPFQAYLMTGPAWNRVITYGWMICGEVNAKNRSGGFTGWQEIAVFFFNGQAISIEWKHTAFLWCGGVPGGFITAGKESRNYGCQEIK